MFHSNEHKCVEKKHFAKNLLSFEIYDKNHVGAFASNSILYVYQNAI